MALKTLTTALAAALVVAGIGAAQAQDRPSNMTLGAASVGGTYYVWGTGVAQVLTQDMGVNTSVEVTGGPLQNIQLVDAGQMELGLVTAAPAYEGFHGLEWADGTEFKNIRALVPMYPSYFHYWAKAESGISSLRDMEGKVVATGPIGGTPDTYGRRVFDVLGIQPRSIVNAGFSDIANQLRDGMIDAALTAAGLPHPAVMDNQSSHKLNIIGVSHEDVDKFREEYPYFSKGMIPQTVYENMPQDLETMTVWNFIIANKDMSDDVAYEITKTLFENVDDLIAVHRSAEDVKLENVAHFTIPIHPGAARYYQEQGVELPEQKQDMSER